MSESLQDVLRRATAAAEDMAARPRTLLVFAHPDDETIAVGARLGQLGAAHFVHVTDGAPRNGEDGRAHGFHSVEAYRAARRKEFDEVLRRAGIPDSSRECFGVPDQEAALALPVLVSMLIEVMERYRPEVVLTHPYEGGHPDHDACAFAVHHAARLAGTDAPLIAEAPFYHAGPEGMVTGRFLEPSAELVYDLSAVERRQKALLFASYQTQAQVLASFGVERECFRVAPHYDFRKPPHPAPVFYDQFPWGVRSAHFCELAAEAEAVLVSQEDVLCR